MEQSSLFIQRDDAIRHFAEGIPAHLSSNFHIAIVKLFYTKGATIAINNAADGRRNFRGRGKAFLV